MDKAVDNVDKSNKEKASLTYRQRFSSLATDIDKHEVFVLAGSIAYTTALALAPFILILLSFSVFFGEDLQDKIYVQM